jgi:miniconductance mechanosensitive channel
MVRQLDPNEYGLPLEIYCFAATTDWVEYENIQSDIFDHILSVVNFFEIRAFQRDAGKK